MIHHHGKGDKDKGDTYSSRGASAVSDWAGAHLSLTWSKGKAKKGLIRAAWVKSRDFAPPDSIDLRRGQDGRFERVQDEGSRAATPEEVVRILRDTGGTTKSKEALATKIMEKLEVSRGTAHKAIDKALHQRLIRREDVRKGRAGPVFLPGGGSDDE